jgi:hypothetical protein
MLRPLIFALLLAAPSASAEQFRDSAIGVEVRGDSGAVLGEVTAVERNADGEIVAAEIPGLEPADAPFAAPELVAEAGAKTQRAVASGLEPLRDDPPPRSKSTPAPTKPTPNSNPAVMMPVWGQGSGSDPSAPAMTTLVNQKAGAPRGRSRTRNQAMLNPTMAIARTVAPSWYVLNPNGSASGPPMNERAATATAKLAKPRKPSRDARAK